MGDRGGYRGNEPDTTDDSDSDEHFAYIAGYTEAGFAFGITWEEWERCNDDDGAQSVRR